MFPCFQLPASKAIVSTRCREMVKPKHWQGNPVRGIISFCAFLKMDPL